MKQIEQQMGDIARSVSGKYARRCWWADPRDLEQQAWEILLDFKVNYAPRVDGTDEIDPSKFGNYAHRAVMRQLSRYLWRQSSPVSLSDHDCAAAVAGTLRKAPTTHPVSGSELLVGQDTRQDSLYLSELTRRRVRSRVVALCGGVVDPWVEAGLEVVVDGEKPGEVALRHGLPSYGLYRQVSWMRSRIAGDRELRAWLRDE